ncbi:hypothetical protein [Arenicella xantha]|uniref:Uncharacterized protein n=1 Tax=Arenicella xantha TaxID=644221 RepID=A0A395JH50_9GAMM|nr:hypothetical protein [Arenicella xantha]RBP47108.1 hypothetical protein DFR28_11071 [Arenicella xantha]
MTRLILIGALLLGLIGCSQPPAATSLYSNEQQALEASTQALTEWANQLLSQVAENNVDVQNAFSLVEVEQQRELTSEELETFEHAQQDIQRRNAEISALFEQSNSLQVALFDSLYQLLGKLDAGAQFCGLADSSDSNLALIAKPSQTAWPELESAYVNALAAGQQALNNNAQYPCEQFESDYEPLLANLRLRVDEVNALMGSLVF